MNFGHWESEIHLDQEQEKRLSKAKKPDMTPSSIDSDNQIGIFKGSGKSDYSVNLDSCSCGDFIRRRLPCKHMYRLALELGFIEGDFEQGRNKNKLYEDVDNLSIEAQGLILDLVGSSIYSEYSVFFLHRNSISEELFKKGFFIENMQNYALTLEQVSLPSIKESLFSIKDTSTLPKKTSQRKTFLKWIDEKEKTDVEFLWDNFIMLEITEQTDELKHKIHHYLHKKFKSRL